MTVRAKVIGELLENNKVKEYDTINFEFLNFYLKNNVNIIMHNEAPTLLKACAVGVVVRNE